VVVTGPVEWKARLTGAKWEDMAKLPWIWTPPDCTFTRIGLEAFEARNLKPKRITVADQEPVIQALVTAGVGLAFTIEEEALIAKAEGKLAIWDKVVGTESLFFIFLKKRGTSDPGGHRDDPSDMESLNGNVSCRVFPGSITGTVQ